MIEYWILEADGVHLPQHLGPFETEQLRDREIRKMIAGGCSPNKFYAFTINWKNQAFKLDPVETADRKDA